MTTRTHVSWRSVKGGRVKHALASADHVASLCGVREYWYRPWVWRDEVDALPECGRCIRVLDQIPFGVPVEHASAPGTAPTANSPESS